MPPYYMFMKDLFKEPHTYHWGYFSREPIAAYFRIRYVNKAINEELMDLFYCNVFTTSSFIIAETSYMKYTPSFYLLNSVISRNRRPIDVKYTS